MEEWILMLSVMKGKEIVVSKELRNYTSIIDQFQGEQKEERENIFTHLYSCQAEKDNEVPSKESMWIGYCKLEDLDSMPGDNSRIMNFALENMKPKYKLVIHQKGNDESILKIDTEKVDFQNEHGETEAYYVAEQPIHEAISLAASDFKDKFKTLFFAVLDEWVKEHSISIIDKSKNQMLNNPIDSVW